MEVKAEDKKGKWFAFTNRLNQHYLDHRYTPKDIISLSYLTGAMLATQDAEKIVSLRESAESVGGSKIYPLGNVSPNSQLASVLASLRAERRNEQTVLPLFQEWKNGQAGLVLRRFLNSIGIDKPVVFHTLRACFATHLLSIGVEPLKVMRMGGWSDLKTFQIYLRMSGVDVKGVAEALDVLPAREDCANVIPLFS